MTPRARTAAGIALLVTGMVGTLLPIIPGIPLFIAGAAILGPDHRLLRPLRRWLRRARPGASPPAESPRVS